MKKNVEYIFTQQEAAALEQSINQLEQLLSSRTIALNGEERQAMSMMGKSRQSFVELAIGLAERNTQFIPELIDIADFRSAIDTYINLLPLFVTIEKLSHKLQDTLYLCGNDAYQASRGMYHIVKWAADEGFEGADTLYKKMSPHFAKSSKEQPEIGVNEDGVSQNSPNSDIDNAGTEPPMEEAAS